MYIIEITDSQADRHDFANEVLMRRMRESLLENIQTMVRKAHFLHLRFGNKFFMTMNEQQQQSFFQSIFNLPGESTISIEFGEATGTSTESPAITISTSALLKALPWLHKSVKSLLISNIALTRQSDVQEMSDIIRAKPATLRVLRLESIECPVDDCMKQDSAKRNGFYDPLLRAASGLLHVACGLDSFKLSAKPRSDHSTLVSPEAVRALLVEGKRIEALSLRGLGLTDSHVHKIVDGLSRGARLNYLDLDSNPGITTNGYGALLNLINRANVIGRYVESSCWRPFCVEDKAWEGELNLVSEMNSQYGRMRYLTKGCFSSEKRRLQWLERVMNLAGQIDDVKRINFIWYILRENPEMMRT